MKTGECETCVTRSDLCITTCPDCVVKHAKHHQAKARAEIVAKLRQSVEEWRHDVEFSFPHLTEDHPCYQSEKECPYCGGANEHYTPPGGKACALQRFFDWIEAGCPS